MDFKSVRFQINQSIEQIAKMTDMTTEEIKRKLVANWEVEDD